MRLTVGRQPHFNPRNPRHAIALDSNLVLENGLMVPIRIRDLSDQGFMAECAAYAEIGSEVAVSLADRGLVRAQIRWALPGRIGVTFREAVDVEGLMPVSDDADDGEPSARIAL